MIADSAAVSAGLVGRDRLDAGEPDLAAVLQAKAARIDDGGDAALALRFERASRRDRRSDGGNRHEAQRRDHREPAATPHRF